MTEQAQQLLGAMNYAADSPCQRQRSLPARRRLELRLPHVAPGQEQASIATKHDGRLLRMVWGTLAGIFFIVGIIGIVLPGLPTTPFLLLTSYFLARTSPRLHGKLLNSKLVGRILRDWEQHRAVRLRTKIRIAVLVSGVLAMLVCLSNLPTALLACILALGVVGLFVIYRLPTVPQTPA